MSPQTEHRIAVGTLATLLTIGYFLIHFNDFKRMGREGFSLYIVFWGPIILITFAAFFHWAKSPIPQNFPNSTEVVKRPLSKRRLIELILMTIFGFIAFSIIFR